jgi:hypothetical protein
VQRLLCLSTGGSVLEIVGSGKSIIDTKTAQLTKQDSYVKDLLDSKTLEEMALVKLLHIDL